jgi:sugar transferase (PEP-CTERM/EpsH1 system associated)
VSLAEKIKILHIIHAFNIGGLENGLVNVINESSRDLFEHEICCVTTTGEAEQRLNRTVRIFEMHKREGNDWRIVSELFHLMRSRKPHIVHTRNWGAIDGIIASRLSKMPVVIHGEHGWNAEDLHGLNLKRRLARRLLSPVVNCFVTVSEDIRDWLIRSVRIKPEKIKKIVNGVDTRRFCNKDAGVLLERCPPQDEIVIGTVGRMDPIKRYDLLLRAFDHIDHNRYKLKLIMVGDGPQSSKLRSIAGQLSHADRIVFAGATADVVDQYHQMDIFVLPSENEGISNTILEAMACGLPIVATAVGGNPELVIHGETGMLIPAGSAEAIYQALSVYLENPNNLTLHGVQARKRVENWFSLDRMVKEYETLYRELYFHRQNHQ